MSTIFFFHFFFCEKIRKILCRYPLLFGAMPVLLLRAPYLELRVQLDSIQYLLRDAVNKSSL